MTLLELYNTKLKAQLQERLGRVQSLEDGGRAVHETLQPLFDSDGPALADLLPQQRSVARQLLEQVYRSARLLEKALCTRKVSVSPIRPDQVDYKDAIPPATAAGLLAAIIAPALNWLIGLGVGAAAGAGCAILYAAVRTPSKRDPTDAIEVATFNAAAVQQWLQEELTAIDRVLADTVLKPLPREKSLDTFGDVISLLQDLLAEYALQEQPLPEILTCQLARIPRLLGNHGITVRSFDPVVEGDSPDPSQWLVERQVDIASPRTLSPMIVKDNKVLRPGRVLLGDR